MVPRRARGTRRQSGVRRGQPAWEHEWERGAEPRWLVMTRCVPAPPAPPARTPMDPTVTALAGALGGAAALFVGSMACASSGSSAGTTAAKPVVQKFTDAASGTTIGLLHPGMMCALAHI